MWSRAAAVHTHMLARHELCKMILTVTAKSIIIIVKSNTRPVRPHIAFQTTAKSKTKTKSQLTNNNNHDGIEISHRGGWTLRQKCLRFMNMQSIYYRIHKNNDVWKLLVFRNVIFDTIWKVLTKNCFGDNRNWERIRVRDACAYI